MSDAARAKAKATLHILYNSADGAVGLDNYERFLDAFAAEQTARLQADLSRLTADVNAQSLKHLALVARLRETLREWDIPASGVSHDAPDS